MPIAIAGAIAAGIGAVSSIVGRAKAAKAAKRAAREEARLEGIVTAEKIRQLHIQERVMKGETIAGYAGGGVKAFHGGTGGQGGRGPAIGSAKPVLAEQAKEFRQERAVTGEAGASRSSNALSRGAMMADQYRYSSYASAASSLGQMFSMWPTSSVAPVSGSTPTYSGPPT